MGVLICLANCATLSKMGANSQGACIITPGKVFEIAQPRRQTLDLEAGNAPGRKVPSFLAKDMSEL